jgi:mRNA-degrading endonuclease RelE of RelBE toxin-antitoxin system
VVISLVVFDDKAIEFLEKLDKNNRERIFNKIMSTKEDPFHYFEKLTKKNFYKLRVGKARRERITLLADLQRNPSK